VLHFREPDWADHLDRDPPNDNCAGRSLDEMAEIIAAGLESFRRWGVKRPVVLRTGNLQADRIVYQAMAQLGLKVASNIGFAIFQAPDPALRLLAGRVRIGDALEVPVLSYAQFALGGWTRYRLMTITGVGTSEMIAILKRARACQISPIVILTHPFEYVKSGEPGTESCLPNRMNQRRLDALCRFLADNADEFVAVSMGEAAQRWLAGGTASSRPLRAPLLPALGSLFANKANDLVRQL